MAGTDRLALMKRAYMVIDRQQARIGDLESQLASRKDNAAEPIAIVGVACRFPGASGADAYWELLASGREAIGEVPADRWNAAALFDPTPETPGRMYTTHGGFLRDIDQFDAAFFGISPREAKAMDPQQRLLLETAWEALDHAGQPRDRLAGDPTGVFVGITASEYGRSAAADFDRIDSYHVTGNTLNAAAGRLSYTLGFSGPCLAVDTACSSSLVAVHLACRAIRQRECDRAVVGGVHLVLSPVGHIALCRTRVLSRSGRCRTFDAAADGMVRGEGCGVVVLRRLADAVRDGDRVLALVRGSAVNQDGPSTGLTVPNGLAQEAVIKSALGDAGLEATQIDYVEAHGTATPLGDPIEIEAIGQALCESRPTETPLLVGSVKTNIGHLEAAAGMAGLIKTVLALERAAIPAHLHLTEPTPRVRWDLWPLEVVTRHRAWPAGDRPRLAGVSAFGFSGTNAHVVVEEAPLRTRASSVGRRARQVVSVSARSEAALSVLATGYATHLRATAGVALGDVSYTANTGRARWAARLCVVASGVEEAAAQLAAAGAGRPAAGVVRGRGARAPRVGWAHGSGSAWAAAAAALYADEPVFRAAVAAVAAAAAVERTAAQLVGEPGGATADPVVAAVAELARGCGLAAVWRAWGVTPWAVTGVGVGAYVAAVTAGVFGAGEAARLLRGQVRVRTSGSSAAQRELARVAQGVAYRAPQVRYVTAPGAGPVTTAAYWTAQPSGQWETTAKPAGLAAAGCEVVLELGAAAGGAPPGDGALAGGPDGSGSGGSLLETLAALWVRGVAVDWEAVHRDQGHQRVTLPSYPWQRQRYWHAVAPSDAAGETATDGWTYRLVWEPPPGRGSEPRAGAAALSPVDLESHLASHLDEIRADARLHRYADALTALETRAAWYAAEAMTQIGMDRAAGVRVDAAEFAERSGIPADRRPLLRRLLTMLDEVGALSFRGGSWETTGRWPDAPATESVEQLIGRYPDAEREIRMLDRCGAALGAVLTGQQDPLALLFPPDASLTAADLYADTLLSDTVNGIVERVVTGIADVQRGGRTIRVLEIGAGTGGVTTAIAPRLPADHTAYLFTDLSSGFLVRARDRFAHLPFLETARLDIERDPATQGFEPAAFDMVVAANVLHATRDLRESLTHVASLLAPGGFLVLLEGTAPRRAIDLIFGLTDGWWRFQDHNLRPSHPLVDPPAWRRVLELSGFEQVDTFGSAPGDVGILASQAVLVARRAASDAAPIGGVHRVAVHGTGHASPGRWVVMGDRGETGGQVADQLRAVGAEVSLVSDRGEDGYSDWAVSDSSDTGVSGVVDLRMLDLPAAPTLTGEGAQHAAEHVCGQLATLVRNLAPVASRRCALHLVTRGAVALEGESLEGVAQAAAWGIGRVVTLEHPELRTCLHDLDPRDRTGDASHLLVDGMLRQNDETLQLIRSGQRRVARLVPYPISGFPSFACDPDGTYLVTGGLGGLGLLLADWLASKGAGRIVLVGRRVPSSPAREAIRAIEAAGRQVVVKQTDVTEPSAVDTLLGWIRENGHRLAGVFHAAGHLDDGILTQLDAQRASAVLKPKVQGAWNLHLATRQAPLDCFVLFSAATSLIGSPGQASHAAANAFLDALAHYRRAQGLSAVSVNWGAWAQAGAVAGAEVAARVRLKGLRLMAPERGLAILERVMTGESPQVGVFDVDWTRIPRSLRALPLLSRCAPQQRPMAEPAVVESPLLVPSSRRRSALAAFVREHVRQVLSMPGRAVVDMEQGFFDLGMDSLTSMELRGRLQTGLGCSLSATEIFDYPTPSALVEHLDALLSPEATTGTSISDRDPPGEVDGKQKIALSEDNVAERLSRKLAELREELSR